MGSVEEQELLLVFAIFSCFTHSIYVLCKVFLMYDILFFLCKHIQLILRILEPWMAKHLDCAQSLSGVHLQQ